MKTSPRTQSRIHFPRLILKAAALLFFFQAALSPAAPEPGFVQARGAKLFEDGHEIRLRGTNLGNWLLQEDFLFGLYGTHSQMRGAMYDVLGKDKADAFWNEYERVYYTDQDAAFLEKMGFNALRVPINENRVEDPNTPGHYDEMALRRIDDVIRVSKAHGIFVILDLHAVMGGQSRQIYADSPSGIPEFWHDADFRTRATEFWQMLARRYKDEPGVAGYDLINEPLTEGHTALLTDWLRTTHRAIRQIDPRHLIWFSGDNYGKGFEGLPEEFWSDPQAVFEFHIYPFFTFPLQKMTEYPQTVDGVRYDHAWLRQHLKEEIDFGKHRPVWMGEFGLDLEQPAKVPMLQKMVRDLIAIADEEGWSWTEWTYKDLKLSGLVSPRPNTPWRQFLDSPEVEAERRKALPIFAVRDAGAPTQDLIAKTTRTVDGGYGWELQYKFNLRAQRVFEEELSYAIVTHLKDRSVAEMRALADSFAFGECRPNEAIVEVFDLRR